MKTVVTSLLLCLFFIACNKSDGCYDASLKHNDFCTTDCPGFEGCDGKTYCNECEAARQGIGP